MSWSEPTSDESNATILVASSIGLIAIIIGVLLFLRRETPEDDFEEEYEENEVMPVQGPPSTAFAGPPATTETAIDPMAEYHRQVEEYNRKMAEYNAWQEAQGSQVNHDSTDHE